MKQLKSLILVSLLCLVVGCDDGDFVRSRGEIAEKNQDSNLKNKGAAEYRIMNLNMVNGRNYKNTILILPEDFGNVGDIIKFTNGVMYAAPK